MDFVIMMNDSSKGLFLIFLVIICNFLADLMNCQVQKQLQQHSFYKWLTTFILIFFTINFTSNPATNPFWIGLQSVFIFFLFVLFMKQELTTFVVALLLLMIIFTLNQWISYYKLFDNKYEKRIKGLQYACLSLQIVLFIVLVIGTMIYYQKQLKAHPEDFSDQKFFFGAQKCQGIEPSIQQTQKKLRGLIQQQFKKRKQQPGNNGNPDSDSQG